MGCSSSNHDQKAYLGRVGDYSLNPRLWLDDLQQVSVPAHLPSSKVVGSLYILYFSIQLLNSVLNYFPFVSTKNTRWNFATERIQHQDSTSTGVEAGRGIDSRIINSVSLPQWLKLGMRQNTLGMIICDFCGRLTKTTTVKESIQSLLTIVNLFGELFEMTKVMIDMDR
ncbi:hypothetical protein HPP92_028798 [Vanilla planifolia]|uniref:Uncharacterized protein n=1 Tax=Vanilla planifolia TaxID=51239 RepID=A0A835U207_VANPL|nr:hypothetical protein HPP92_028798 [Vanilla planifolia]KAG0446529.1 hypothetical protein HPP92_028787 [Vanilla planifolia]